MFFFLVFTWQRCGKFIFDDNGLSLPVIPRPHIYTSQLAVSVQTSRAGEYSDLNICQFEKTACDTAPGLRVALKYWRKQMPLFSAV